MPSTHSRRQASPSTANTANANTSNMANATSSSPVNGMTPFPSDLSIFSHNDEEVGDELVHVHADGDASPSFNNSDDEPTNTNDSNKTNKSDKPDADTAALVGANARDLEDEKRLSKELLDALYLGTSNFLLAYNTRAGIGVLMRIFKLLQKGNVRGVMDLQQLLDEKHLSFRVEAVSMGLFLGWFTGGYRALRALLPRLLTRLLLLQKQRQGRTSSQLPDREKRVVDELSTLGAGAGAACAIVFVNAKRRRSLALYALTRALQCAYNTAKRRQLWHFWGSDWEYGDSLLFALSTAQIMYAFIMRPSTLPSDYFRFIQKTGPVEKEVLEMVRLNNRGLPLDPQFIEDFIAKHSMTRDFPVPEGLADSVSCRFIHHQSETCPAGTVATFRKAFVSAFPLYLSLFIVPGVVIHFKKFLARPFSTLGRAVLNATRSNVFLSTFVASYMALICMQRQVMPKDNRFVYYLAGFFASGAILIEPKSRRSELALYALPRAIDSLFMILRDRRIVKGVQKGEVLVFALSMAFMMRTYEHEKDSMGSFFYSTLKRFLQSPSDKKKIFLSHMELQQQQQRASSPVASPHKQ